MGTTAAPLIGVNLTLTHNEPEFELGTEYGAGEDKYVYLRASGALVLGTVYKYDSTFTVGTGVATADTPPSALAVPQITFDAPTSGYTYRYGWFQVKGTFAALLAAASATASTRVYTTSTAGRLGVTAASSSLVPGLYLMSAVGGSAATTTAFAAQDLLFN